MKKYLLFTVGGLLLFTAIIFAQLPSRIQISSLSSHSAEYHKEFKIRSNNGQFGLFFRDKTIATYQFDEIIEDPENRIFLTRQGDRFGAISIRVLRADHIEIDGFFDDRWQLLENEDGTTTLLSTSIIPNEFDEISKRNGRFWVKQGSKYGILSSGGSVIIRPEFDEITMQNGRFWVRNGDKHGIFSLGGSLLIRPEFDEIRMQNGRFWVRNGDKHGIFSSGGSLLIRPEFDEIRMQNGRFWVRNGSKYGVFSSGGSVIIRPEFDRIRMQNGRFIAYRNNVQYTFSSSGSLIR